MQRYRNLIDDWNKFRQESQEPITRTVRKNPLKAGEDFEQRLKQNFKQVEESEWNPEVYRLPETKKPGDSVLHWRGEYYVQEESASLPVKILKPKENDEILDMCAAPGGKTTQIAAAIKNNGKIIANDQSSKRLQSLTANKYRTGSAAAATTNYDARNLPENQKYDKILLDAPCSGEADRARRNFEAADKEEIKNLSKLQKQLIEKAEKLLKDDGTLVYSTCTIAPEENEAVVKHATEETDLKLKHAET
ncbi:MAG: RsmB/NOP family class I SAM-dependent RNA methyltransferase [Candidatus Nanohaloarchaea archaeon]